MYNCECKEEYNIDPSAKESGATWLQNEVEFFFPEKKGDRRLMQIYVLVKYIGTPSHVYGGGLYEITTALGWEHLVGNKHVFGNGTIK